MNERNCVEMMGSDSEALLQAVRVRKAYRRELALLPAVRFLE